MQFGLEGNIVTQDGQAIPLIQATFGGKAFLSQPDSIVMHFTYGSTARSTAEWFRSAANPGSSAHLVIDRDGSVLQCMPLDKIAWHAGNSEWKGRKGFNNFSIGIELSNWGYLRRAGSGWQSYTGVPIPDPLLATHKNGNPDNSREPIGWEPYPEIQFQAAADIARVIVEKLGIKDIVGHDDIAPTRKWDPGPAFDMARFRGLVFGERGLDGGIERVVNSTSGLNLRTGPGLHYPSVGILALGTRVMPIETNGSWLGVSVLDDSGRPDVTGWVYAQYLT